MFEHQPLFYKKMKRIIEKTWRNKVLNYDQIISEMTLEEKFNYLTGSDMNSGYKLERFPIEKI